MAHSTVHAAFCFLGVLALILTLSCCIVPKWRLKKMSEHTVFWEGLWELCQDDGLYDPWCMEYDSLQEVPLDLQVSRVLVVICIIIIFLGLFLYIRFKMTGIGLFLGAGLLLLVSVSWVTHNVILGRANPQLVSQWKPEMGASLYLGWVSSLLLLLGGAILGGAHLWFRA